jgi:hypothetical protein
LQMAGPKLPHVDCVVSDAIAASHFSLIIDPLQSLEE